MPVSYFVASTALFSNIGWIASRKELLKAGDGLDSPEPMIPPRATVSKTHTFHTMMPASTIAEHMSIAIQSRTGSWRAPARSRFKKELEEIEMFME